MTLKEQQAYLNKEFIINLQNLMVRVKVIDVKTAFGHTQFLVTPTDPNSSGEIWIRQDLIITN